MANEFLVSKWKIWYESLDVNHDGTISMDDVNESRAKFTELHKELQADKAKAVSENFEAWWTEYIFRGKAGDISESDFVATLTKDFNADQAAFKAQMDKCFNTFFDVIDTNKDRSIDEGEFNIAFKAYGHESVATDTNFFSSYGPSKEGLVPLRDIVNSWIDFVTNPDSSKKSIVKDAFEAANKK